MEYTYFQEYGTDEACNIDSVLNCLRIFNLENIEIRNKEEIKILHVVIDNIINNNK